MLIPVVIHKIELSNAFTAVYLGNQDRTMVIFCSSSAGKILQQLVAQVASERPACFDVMLSLVTGCNLKPMHILIDDEKDGVFYTKIFLEKTEGELLELFEIDARPSDALCFALHYQIPILVTESLFQKASTSIENAI